MSRGIDSTAGERAGARYEIGNNLASGSDVGWRGWLELEMLILPLEKQDVGWRGWLELETLILSLEKQCHRKGLRTVQDPP